MASRKTVRRDSREIIQQFLSSDTTQKRFCHENGIPLSTLQYWLKRHRCQQSKTDRPVFLPVEVSALSTTNQISQNCEIEYPNGVRIRFSEPVSVSLLVQLVLARGQ